MHITNASHGFGEGFATSKCWKETGITTGEHIVLNRRSVGTQTLVTGLLVLFTIENIGTSHIVKAGSHQLLFYQILNQLNINLGVAPALVTLDDIIQFSGNIANNGRHVLRHISIRLSGTFNRLFNGAINLFLVILNGE